MMGRTLYVTGALAALLTVCASRASAQDDLARAKTLYASASYEDALTVLSSLHGKTPPAQATDVAMYEVFCLVALGRGDDAKQAIETIVRDDPQYRLPAELASPRVQTMFDTLRLPLLPGLIRESYVRGREAFDGQDLPAALKEFDRVVALADELEPAKDPGLRDLRTLASGFRDLVRRALAPPPVPAPPPTPAAKPDDQPAAPAAPTPATTTTPAAANARAAKTDARRTYGANDTDVKPPVAISQVFPPWRPVNAIEWKRQFQGAVDLLIDEQGHVASAAIVKSVHERYDPVLLDAARRWTYRPATRGGQPVPYRLTIAVNLVTR